MSLEPQRLYRVMFQAPATAVTYVVEEIEATPCVQNGVTGWTVKHPENVWPEIEFVPAERLYEDFDDAALSCSRWQQQMDAYQARKKKVK
jgi:hypothetical protein